MTRTSALFGIKLNFLSSLAIWVLGSLGPWEAFGGGWKVGAGEEPGSILSFSLGFRWHLLQQEHLLLVSISCQTDPPSVVLDASRQHSWHSSSCQPALASGAWGTPVRPLAPSTVAVSCYCYTIPCSDSPAFLCSQFPYLNSFYLKHLEWSLFP